VAYWLIVSRASGCPAPDLPRCRGLTAEKKVVFTRQLLSGHSPPRSGLRQSAPARAVLEGQAAGSGSCAYVSASSPGGLGKRYWGWGFQRLFGTRFSRSRFGDAVDERTRSRLAVLRPCPLLPASRACGGIGPSGHYAAGLLHG